MGLICTGNEHPNYGKGAAQCMGLQVAYPLVVLACAGLWFALHPTGSL